MANKRYYWIKLRQDFYESNDAVDFLMTQTDGHGSDYVVLYHMLCLKTINTRGGLYSQLGEMIVPYDVDKIVRDCKYFERYIVTQALQLYKTLGLVYEEKKGGYLAISDFESLIGSESDSAERVRKHRGKEKALQCNKNVTQNVTQDIDIELEKDRELENSQRKKEKREKNITTQRVRARVCTSARACEGEKSYQSHAEVMDEFCVSETLRPALEDFLRHCYANGVLKTNDELRNIVVRLDFAYRDDEQAKAASVRRAISGGYMDIAEKM